MAPWQEIVREHAIGVDHLAIAVAELEASVAVYTGLLGCELLTKRETRGEHTGMTSVVLRLGSLTIVLMQGLEPESQITRFIDEFGPGVQHVAIEVRELDVVVGVLRDRGMEFETPVIESPHTRQIFTKRDPRLGVRIELIERGGEDFADTAVEQLFRHMEANHAV